MAFRLSPLWWPVLAAASPVLVPLLAVRNRRFTADRARADRFNREHLDSAGPLDLPELESLSLTVLAEEAVEEGFLGESGVSYLFETDRGALLFDVSYGPESRCLAHNLARLGLTFGDVDALAVSHLHLDHMGGLKAARTRTVRLPQGSGLPQGRPCFLPDEAAAEGLRAEVVEGPRLLAAGLASTGPLARSLFFVGWCQEQALVARLKGKGLAVFTGCGHPGLELILDMVGRLSGEPIYAVGGGLHYPVTRSRGARAGIQFQTILGTGKPPWRRITDRDLDRAIAALNRVKPRRVLLSAHDTCDHALERLAGEVESETDVLRAGATYRL